MSSNTIDLSQLVESGVTVGFEIPPNSSVRVLAVKLAGEEEDAVFPFHLLSACLGPKVKQGDRAVLSFGEERESVCASLTVGVCENVQLDLQFADDFVLSNRHASGTSIHVVGRIVSDTDGGDSSSDEEEFDLFGGRDSSSSEEDEDDLAPPTKVTISQLDSEEEESSEEKPVSKKLKVQPEAKTPKTEAKTPKTEAKTPKAEVKKEAKTPAATPKLEVAKTPKTPGSGKTPSKDELISFVKGEIKTAGKIKGTELGQSVAQKFGMSFKGMGMGEKSMAKFLQQEAKDIKVDGEVFSLNNH